MRPLETQSKPEKNELNVPLEEAGASVDVFTGGVGVGLVIVCAFTDFTLNINKSSKAKSNCFMRKLHIHRQKINGLQESLLIWLQLLKLQKLIILRLKY